MAFIAQNNLIIGFKALMITELMAFFTCFADWLADWLAKQYSDYECVATCFAYWLADWLAELYSDYESFQVVIYK